MFRRLARVTAALAAAFGIGIGMGGVAFAEPDADGALCHYTITDPRVVDVSGTQMVSSTATPAGCTGTAKPISTQVCITTAASAGRCVEYPGYGTARVFFSPYIPGTSYTAKGRGCAAQTTPPAAICSSLGPRTATL